MELDGVLEAKKIVEEENGRLMERASAVQQQETAYKRMQDTVTSTNEAKSRLAYEKGKLQVFGHCDIDIVLNVITNCQVLLGLGKTE